MNIYNFESSYLRRIRETLFKQFQDGLNIDGLNIPVKYKLYGIYNFSEFLIDGLEDGIRDWFDEIKCDWIEEMDHLK